MFKNLIVFLENNLYICNIWLILSFTIYAGLLISWFFNANLHKAINNYISNVIDDVFPFVLLASSVTGTIFMLVTLNSSTQNYVSTFIATVSIYSLLATILLTVATIKNISKFRKKYILKEESE